MGSENWRRRKPPFCIVRYDHAQGKKQQAYDYLKRHTDFLRRNSFSIDSKKIEDLTQTNSREERERLIETQ